MRNAEEFYRITVDSPPWPLMMRAAALVPKPPTAPPRALDLGCGAGRDTRYLLAQGFDVTAVDENPAALAYLERTAQAASVRLHLVRSVFQDFPFAASVPSTSSTRSSRCPSPRPMPSPPCSPS